MIALITHLAGQVSAAVQTGVRLEAITPTATGWQLQAADGRRYYSRAVLLTPPVPSALSLLAAGGTRLHPDDQAALEKIDYAPSLVGAFRVKGATRLPGLGAVQLPDAPIRFLIDNQRKGISPQAVVLTAQASADYSRRLWDEPDTAVIQDFQRQIRAYLQPGATIVETHLRRWRHALPIALHPAPYLLASDLPPLLFAGDAFGTLRAVEGAALSGLAAAEALTQILSKS